MTTPCVVGRHYPISGGAAEKRTVGRRHCLLSYLRGPDGARRGGGKVVRDSAAGGGGEVSERQSPRLRPEVLLDGAEPPSAAPVADATGAAPPYREDEAAPVARGGLASRTAQPATLLRRRDPGRCSTRT